MYSTCTSIKHFGNITETFTYEEHNWTVTSSGRKVLDNSTGLDVISLLVKY